jgi:hypothetical protein
MEELGNLRNVPRVTTEIPAYIFYEDHMYFGKILNLSCWGARIRLNQDLSSNDLVNLNFVYSAEYSLPAEVVEKINDNEYRVKFIFFNLQHKESLNRDIN